MTLAAVAIGAAVVGGVVSTIGAVQAGNAQKAAEYRNAQISERNKVIAKQDTIQAVQTAEIAAEDKRRENRRQYASIRASYGSSGFELSGSPLDVLADTSQEMALDERRVSYEGNVRNREGALQMLYLQEQADSSRVAGKNAKRAGYISGFSSMLSSAGKAAEMGAM